MNNFQTIIIAIFLAFFVFAVLIFSGVIKIGGGSSTSGLQGKVVIWGTFPISSVNNVIQSMDLGDLKLSYEEKDADTYQQDLIEAFANGVAPDLFIITPDMIVANTNFIFKIPYENYLLKEYNDTFIEGASIYLDNKDGIIGLPILVDPIVLYYNKDILTNDAIISPPKNWDELFVLNPTLTKKEDNGKINQSMIALGQYKNIKNAKDILATLLLQNNNPIATKGDNPKYYSVLGKSDFNLSTQTVLDFFIEFSNPSNTAYSWNGSLSNSLDLFISGKLAFYLGRASELFKIESINPNLSFDVTDIPQIKNSPIKRTYGEIYALAINKKSTNMNASFAVLKLLSSGENAKNLSIALSLPPVSKALLSNKPAKSPYLYTFYNSALISRSWLDPSRAKSDLIFKELIENILSNNLSINDSISKANGQLDILFNK